MIKEIKTECGDFQVYENYIIGTIKEGTIFNAECTDIIWDIVTTYFKNRTFGYISNRVYSYSLDPTIYIGDSTERFTNLKAMAVVSKRGMQKSNARLERQFFKAKFEIFDELSDAEDWMNNLFHYSKSNSLSI